MTTKLNTILDHGTDLVGIGALTTVAYTGTAGPEVIAAITTVALGRKYLSARTERKQSAEGQ